MWEIVFWLYFANAVLLIVHEIDSAYWREWELFRLKGDISLFLVLHIPMMAALLYGLVEVFKRGLAGLVISLIVSAAGIFAFSIHVYFMSRGGQEFRKAVSIFVLVSTLVVSAFQAVLTLMILLS